MFHIIDRKTGKIIASYEDGESAGWERSRLESEGIDAFIAEEIETW